MDYLDSRYWDDSANRFDWRYRTKLRPVRTVPPGSDVLPISVGDAKKHLRIEADVGDDDPTIDILISAAASMLDGRTGILGRALMTQTWRQDFYAFEWKMRLDPPPVMSVSSVTYYDGNNVQQTLSPSTYRLLVDDAGPYVAAQPTKSWPGTFWREDAISVTFLAGYGDKPADVPAAIRQAMLLMIGHWFENREQVVVDSRVAAVELPLGVEALLAPYRVMNI